MHFQGETGEKTCKMGIPYLRNLKLPYKEATHECVCLDVACPRYMLAFHRLTIAMKGVGSSFKIRNGRRIKKDHRESRK